MIHTFDDFCLWMFVLVDDCWAQIAPLLQRPGPRPRCSDSELVTLALLSECLGWDKETDLISLWRAHGRLFPHLPSRSRFNRRRRALAG
ncbi:MAG: IS982 family transposase, partial [Chloroflexota bacterium]|nr:IS982 family transposase [Chloroflexota bacterium]